VLALTIAHKVKRRELCEETHLNIKENGFVERLIFPDEANFYISGKLKRHNVRIWGTTQPLAQINHQRDSPKVDVFYEGSHEKMHGAFFFSETTVTGDSFLDVLENWLLPRLNTNYD
jgi:hypothetical protein